MLLSCFTGIFIRDKNNVISLIYGTTVVFISIFSFYCLFFYYLVDYYTYKTLRGPKRRSKKKTLMQPLRLQLGL